MMLADGFIVSDDIIPRPRKSTGVHTARSTSGGHGRSDKGVIVDQVEIETRLEFQSGNEGHFQESTSGKFILHTFRLIERKRSRQVPVRRRSGRPVRPEIGNKFPVRISL